MKNETNHDKVIEDRAEEICEALNQRGARLDKRDEEEIFQALKDIYQRGREDAFGEVSGWIDKGLDKLKAKE